MTERNATLVRITTDQNGIYPSQHRKIKILQQQLLFTIQMSHRRSCLIGQQSQIFLVIVNLFFYML